MASLNLWKPPWKEIKRTALWLHRQIRTEKEIPVLERFLEPCKNFIDRQSLTEFAASLRVLPDFIDEHEENILMEEIQPHIKKLPYEQSHWDDAIHGYREREKLEWNSENQKVIERIRKEAFDPSTATLKYVHVLDLAETGFIKPHVDSQRFCGETIAGLSLLSPSVMRFAHEKQPELVVSVLLPRRSLYIMSGTSRHDYTHEILKQEESMFHGVPVCKTRRISVMCRSEPDS